MNQEKIGQNEQIPNFSGIEEAKIEDLDAITALNHKLCIKENREFDATIDPDYPTSQRGKEGFKEEIENLDSLTLVAKAGDKVIGYLMGGHAEVEDYRTVKNIYEIGSMWVDDKYRGKGIGTKLMDRFEDWARERGATRLKVIASAQNEGAINLYRKRGFENYDLVLEKDLVQDTKDSV